jgi:hypothetical protein
MFIRCLCGGAFLPPGAPRAPPLRPGGVAAPASQTISIIGLGGDPTGRNDSSAAFAAALSAAATLARGLGLGAVGAGGVTIDLGGGTFLLSAPIAVVGEGFTLSGGTLLADAASNGWPPGACLLDVVGSQNIAFAALTLDGAHVACGARFDNVVQVDFSGVFVLHYKDTGIHGDDQRGASHELMVSDCFFAEYMWGERGFDDIGVLQAVAIYLEPQFYDSNFYNSIIRCTRVGIVNLAGANLFHGMHVYATCNKNPDAYNVSVGLLQGAWSQTRVANCYWDDSPVVITSPNQITIKDNLFYGLSGLLIAPAHADFAAAGVLVQGNVFTSTAYSGASPALHYDVKNGTVNASALAAVAVADNFVSAGGRATRVAATAAASASALAAAAAPGAAAAALLAATFNGTLDLRPSLLLLPGGTPPPAFDWRRAAAPALARMAARAAAAGQPAVGAAAGPAAAGPPDAFGGAIAQLQATAALTSLSLGGVALPLAGAGAAPLVSLAPTDVPGVLALAVALQPMAGGPSAAWEVAAAAAAAAKGSPLTAAWTALVSVQADQALPNLVGS